MKKTMLSAVLGCALGVLAPSAFAWDQQPNHYKVRIDADARRAHVEAEVWIEGKELAMFNAFPIPGLKDGQASFIDQLDVRAMDGQPIAVKDKGEGEYELQGDRRVRLRYDVRLDHDKYDWPGGQEEVLYHTEEGVMAIGYYLFLVPGEKMLGQTRVEFDLPKGWSARTPWKQAGAPNSFTADTRRELVNNALFLGTAQQEEFTSGGMRISMVLGKRHWQQRAIMRELIERQLTTYVALFGRPPLAERYLIVANPGATGDGGAFAGSFSQFLKGDINAMTRPFWGRVMAHELLHFWNGHSLVPAAPTEEWFKEGVTDYLTVTTMARNGLFDQAHVTRFLENLGRGQSVARQGQGLKSTVRDAVKDKHNAWLLVYGGGAIAGLAMDVELRRASHNKVGLPDVMKALYAEFAHPGKTYTHADIVRVARQVGGVDLDPMLQKIVARTEPFDLKPVMRELGFEYEHFLFMLEHDITPRPDANAAQKQRFRDIFGFDYK